MVQHDVFAAVRVHGIAGNPAELVETLGELDNARRSVTQLRKERPDFTLGFAEKKLFYLKDPEQLRIYLEGLALAGVPE